MDIQFLLLLQYFREATNGIFNDFFLYITEIGWSVLPYLVIALVYWCLNRKTGEFMMMNVGAASWINSFLKVTFCVYRPWIRSAEVQPLEGAKAASTGYSFPSGHTSFGTAVYGSIAVKGRDHKILRNTMIVLVILIAFSRNYLGVHTPQDVLVSLGIGIFLLWFLTRVQKWVDAREGRDLYYLLICTALCVLLLLYCELKSYPLDYVDGTLLVDPVKMKRDCFGDIGIFFGYTLGSFLEHRRVRFTTDVKRAAAVSRFVSGIFPILVIYYCSYAVFKMILPKTYAMLLADILLGLDTAWIHPAVFTAREKRKDAKKEGISVTQKIPAES